MIMTIDVGNTNITVGVFRGDEVVSNFRITTKMPRTSDEYGITSSIYKINDEEFTYEEMVKANFTKFGALTI